MKFAFSPIRVSHAVPCDHTAQEECPFGFSCRVIQAILLMPVLLLIIHSSPAKAQNQIDLETFNLQRNQTNQKGMVALGSWAALNIGSGAILTSQTTGRERYFHQMNMMWNFVNIGLATSGYLGAKKATRKTFNLAQSIQAQHKLEKILLFNAGLDFAYIATGAWMNDRGISTDDARTRGYGQSLILQGGFLLGFDVVMYLLINGHRKNNPPIITNLGTFPGGFRFVAKF